MIRRMVVSIPRKSTSILYDSLRHDDRGVRSSTGRMIQSELIESFPVSFAIIVRQLDIHICFRTTKKRRKASRLSVNES